MSIKALEKLREFSHLDDNKWTLETGEVVSTFVGNPSDPNAVNWGEQWRKMADEIEVEIAERCMELPEGWTTEQASEVLDLWPRWDDGSPCMFGDEFTCYPKYDMNKKYEVFDKLTIFWKNHVWNRGKDEESPHDGGFYEWNYMRPGGDGCEQYRPTKRKLRTIEDVLCDMIHEYGSTDALTETIAAKYAAELRGMMEADDD